MTNPLTSLFITSPFGKRAPVNASNFTTGTNHAGVDLRAAVGTSAYAIAGGTVTEVGTNHGAWGNYVKVKMQDGYTAFYAHLSKIEVAKGATVAAGQEIAKTGATGNVKGAHLHFGVYNPSGAAVDPLKYVAGLGANAAQVIKSLDFSQPLSGDMSAAAAVALIGAALVALGGMLENA